MKDSKFEIGDRVEHTLYGRGCVVDKEFVGLVCYYNVRMDDGPKDPSTGERVEDWLTLPQDSLEPVDVVTRLGDLTR